MLSRALITEADGIIVELSGGDTGVWIEGDIETMKTWGSAVPAIALLTRRVGVFM